MVVLSVSVEANSNDGRLDGMRPKRSLEGQPCDPAGANSSCTLAYTTCNPRTKKCECDKNVSVSMTLPMFPDVVDCIPLDYVRTTGQCLPTIPDICSVLTPGAFCDTHRMPEKGGHLKCTCQIGGIYPNCTMRIGSLCRTNDTCLKDLPHSFCGNITDGLGKCMCGEMDGAKRYISNQVGDTCLPTNCAANPCRGNPTASTCVDTPQSYNCNCRNGTKGRSHSFGVDGICCDANEVPCLDLKKCIRVEELCDGKSDCEDCSDEKQFFCVGQVPTDNLRCSAIREREITSTLVAIPVSQSLPSSMRQVQMASQSAPANAFLNPGGPFFAPGSVSAVPMGRSIPMIGW